jgi:superfamily II DNA or RNA helicase
MSIEPLQRWPHQSRGVKDVLAARDAGHRVIVKTSPTGGGKSLMTCDLIDDSLTRDEKSVLYTNRKMLMEQTVRVMERHGITHGVRAAGWEGTLGADVQVSSIQTEHARVMRKQAMDLHAANLVIVDEAHMQKGPSAQAIYRRHLDSGATIVLVTATPIDLGNVAGVLPHLVVAGTNSELRQCGALVKAYHYGPDEPDTRKVRKQPWEYTENDVRKLIMVQGIFGRVLGEFQRLNPDQRPSILFAPGVAESIWFAQQFAEAGISAAHIDGKECWVDGEFHKSDRGVRDQILADSKSGRIKVVCNRFVLREGIDAPWLEHGIFATVFGSLQSYLQSGGRLLRACPGKGRATIQDHGGNWHRHGSLNADRVWNLTYTEAMYHGMREAALREKREPEPFLCPRCRKVLDRADCKCGFKVTRKVRPVVQADGSIKEHEGDIYKPHRVCMKSDTMKLWEQKYYQARHSKNGMTFRQAEALFFLENHYYPPHDLPLMPADPVDWHRKVKDVPREGLTS